MKDEIYNKSTCVLKDLQNGTDVEQKTSSFYRSSICYENFFLCFPVVFSSVPLFVPDICIAPDTMFSLVNTNIFPFNETWIFSTSKTVNITKTVGNPRESSSYIFVTC